MKGILIPALIYFVVIVSSCKKNSSEQTGNPGQNPAEEFTTEELQELDNTPQPKLTMNDIVLPNGEIASQILADLDTAFFHHWLMRTTGDLDKLGPLDAKNFLIKQFSAITFNLVNRSLHQFPDEGPGKPAQNGIAYSYGSKNFSIRQKPAESNCTEPVYGLDCSGMMSVIFKETGIQNFPDGADNQRRPANIQRALETSFPQLRKVKVEDLGRLETSKLMAGDIVYWIKPEYFNTPDPLKNGIAGHIGLILKDKTGKLVVYFSSGSPGTSEDDCDNNRGTGRGPRSYDLNNSYWFGTTKHGMYGVVRFNFEIEGKWEFNFRCNDQQTILFTLNLNFPPSENKEFTIGQDFTDYDGSPNHVDFNFKYDNTTSQLSCEFVLTDGWITGFERKDSFMVTLEKDDSGFITANQIYIHGGTGCIAAIQLINRG